MSVELQEKKRLLADQRGDHAKRFNELKSLTDAGARSAKLEEIDRAEDALKSLHDEVVQLESIENRAAQNELELKSLRAPMPTTPFETEGGMKRAVTPRNGETLGDALINSDAFKSWKEGSGTRVSAFELESFKSIFDAAVADGGAAFNGSNVKATLTTTGLTAFDRQPGIVLQGVQTPRVADLIPQGETGMPTVRYLQETSFTPAATAVAEGAAKPEATFALNEVDAPVRKIAVIVKVTDEMLSDFPAVRDYVNQRLPFMIELEEDNQLLNGSGTGANIRGILQTSGILTQAMGFQRNGVTAIPDDNAINAISRGMVRVQAESFFEPTGVVMNPFDWEQIRTIRTGDGGSLNGLYIMGAPSEVGARTLWGLPIVTTTRIAEGTALVGAWNLGAQIFRRMGVTVQMTNANEDDFKFNRVAIRAEERLALAVYRPAAFAKVTGI